MNPTKINLTITLARLITAATESSVRFKTLPDKRRVLHIAFNNKLNNHCTTALTPKFHSMDFMLYSLITLNIAMRLH